MGLSLQPMYKGEPCITYGTAEDVCLVAVHDKMKEDNLSLSAAEIALRGKLKNERVFKMRNRGREICLSIPALKEIIATGDLEDAQ